MLVDVDNWKNGVATYWGSQNCEEKSEVPLCARKFGLSVWHPRVTNQVGSQTYDSGVQERGLSRGYMHIGGI